MKTTGADVQRTWAQLPWNVGRHHPAGPRWLAQSRGCLDGKATAADPTGEGGEGRPGEGETQRSSKNGSNQGWMGWQLDGWMESWQMLKS